MTPTRLQLLWASDWLPTLWQWGWAFAAMGYAISRMEPNFAVLLSPWYLLLFCFASVTSWLGGWFAGLIPGWIFFSPTLYEKCRQNGGPFVAGDQVQVLAGKYRGSISRVYGNWQHETVRVDLGPAAKEAYADIFSGYQLLRVESRAQRRELIHRLNNRISRQEE